MHVLQQQLTSFFTVAVVFLLYTSWRLLEILLVAFDKDLRRVPGPVLSSFSHWPLKFAALGGKRSVYIHALHKQYGPFVRISPTEIAIADIAAWRHIHRVGSDFRKNPNFYQRLSPLQYDDNSCSVFGICDPQKASARRKLYQSAGTKRVGVDWESQVVQLVDLTIQQIKRELKIEKKCDIMKWWTLMATDVLGDLAFGESFHHIENGEKSRMILDIESTLPLLGVRLEIPWLYEFLVLVQLPQTKELAKIYQRLAQYSHKAVENTRQASKSLTKTLFSKMVLEDGSQSLPDDVIENEATNALFAGTDTIAMTLTYLTYAVLKDDTVKQKLVDEIRAGPEHPTWEQLESMTYLNNVVQEAMRRYPAIPGSLTRVAPYGGALFNGKYFIPAGTIVSTQAYTFHRDPRVFNDPLSFNPDRWQHPTPAMKEHMMTFGGPVRSCLGENIARLEILHAVSKLLRECGNIRLAPSTTDESMEIVDYFAIRPKAGVCIIESA